MLIFLGIIQKWDFSFENRFFFENIISLPKMNFTFFNLYIGNLPWLQRRMRALISVKEFFSLFVWVFHCFNLSTIYQQFEPNSFPSPCSWYPFKSPTHWQCAEFTFTWTVIRTLSDWFVFISIEFRSDLFGFNRIFGVVLSISFDFHSQRRSFSNQFSCRTVQNASKWNDIDK